MLIDLLKDSNYIKVNYKVAKKIGLEEALYLQQLIEMDSGKEDFHLIDRASIFEKTQLTELRQNEIDTKFKKLGFIEIKSSIKDPLAVEIKLNLPTIIEILSSEEQKINGTIKKIKLQKTSSATTQKELKIRGLKNSLTAPNEKLLQCYKDWVDGVYSNPKGFLSLKSIRLFQDTIRDFCKGDETLEVKLVEIATIHGLRDANWAIEVFHRDFETQYYKTHTKSSSNKKIMVSSEIF